MRETASVIGLTVLVTSGACWLLAQLVDALGGRPAARKPATPDRSELEPR